MLCTFRDICEEWGDSNFQLSSQNCQFHHRQVESEHFNVCFSLDIILSTRVSVLDLIYIYILSVYSTFSDRVGLPLHNTQIPSPFTSIMPYYFLQGLSFFSLNRLRTGVACSDEQRKNGSTSTETQHASVVRLLKPSSICYNAHYPHIPAFWMTF